MIKKIKKISQIGVFENFSWWSCELWDFTAFFWENTFGKTTLTKIFKSLQVDDWVQIQSLKTIAPFIPWVSQEIEIKCLDRVTNSEYSINYVSSTTSWTDNRLKGNIHIFDNDFIHKHLITWVEITHGNREKFTDFILWEEAVSSINEIEELKRKWLTLRNELKSLKPMYLLKEISDVRIKEFLELKITSDEDILLKEKSELKLKTNNLSLSENIIKLPNIEDTSPIFLEDLEIMVGKINTILVKDFEDVTNTTLENIKNHISIHTNWWEAVDWWIKSWFLEHQNSNICPYCWQDTKDSILLEDFSKFFNKAYSEFSLSITENLRVCVNTLYNNIKPDLYDSLLGMVWNLRKYYIYDNNILIPDSISERVEEVNWLEKLLIEKFSDEKERIKWFCSNKKQAPHKKVDPIKISDNIKTEYLNLKDKVTLIYKDLWVVACLSNDLKKYHQNLIAKWINDERKLLENKSLVNDKAIARIQQSSQCDSYMAKMKEIEENDRSLKIKEEVLDVSQSIYLDKYFTSINEIYKTFWNRNFQLIKKEWPKRWNRKTYFLSIKYKGHEISESDFPKLMSESEKRSLAFAVFLARIQQLEIVKKNDAIIILDDPVVSFDQTRIDATVIYLRAYVTPSCKQLIVLTHYENFMRSIQEQYKTLPLSFYYEIEKWWKYSIRDKKCFMRSLESIYYSKLSQFADGTSNDIDQGLPRVFMEKYIDSRFQKQLFDSGLNLYSDLKDKIDILPIDSSKKLELQCFKNDFNDPHHNFTNPIELENFRTSVGNLIEKLYSL